MNGGTLTHRVLLIEDNERFAQQVHDYLGRYGFAVTIVRRGDLAVAAVREHLPALVMLDPMPPDSGGLELCRQIRACSNVPVIVLTARADACDQVAVFDAGADDYLVKPLDPRVLVARARALLRRAYRVSPDEADAAT
ncbi:hypothetical protein P350_35250 [Burkholderia cepacia JBK9]|uniref:Response regulator protein n=1 Tax=Burkholderia arboris TaxID=488730 RepID=A0A9Q9UUZ4_9BURK|nr:hypothetical protein P350_35250 [Burkholderia cepacia JBK9]VWC44570.1 response regulator protein [Burkholderia arboris]